MEGSATDIDKVGSSSKHMPLVRVYSGSSVSQTSVDNEEEPSAGSLAVQIVPTDPVVVTKANKIICATAFILIILSMTGYIVQLYLFHMEYPKIMKNAHFTVPGCALYVVLGSDILISFIGIWTSVAQTGPKFMLFVCIWLLLSSLVTICIPLSLEYENKKFREEKAENCADKDSISCQLYDKISIYYWCSVTFAFLKLATIFLCRINFPHVFNWLRGKQVLVDEIILEEHMKSLTNLGALGGGYFDPCDIERLVARGSVGGNVLTANESNIILVRSTSQEGAEHSAETQRRKSRRATMISLSPQ